MNHIYRLVWSDVLNAFVACAELTRAHGKRGCLTVLAAAVLTAPALAADLPTGGQIVAGSGHIAQSGSTLTVTQDSQRIAADWQSFSIGNGNTVNFVQPSASSVALNRVLGSDVSVIQGALNANGQVFLVNPNGLLFTPGAQVNVGSLVASTLDITVDDFMAGRYRFSGDSDKAVINQGSIKAASGGTIALIAGTIVNAGTIEAPRGDVLMGAGRKVTLDLGGPVKIQIDEGALQAQIDQGGVILAEGGRVYLTAEAAGDLASAAINHTGIIEAKTLATGERGEIILLGDLERGTVQVSGRLDASAPNGGDGGFVETSAARIRITDDARITTRAAHGANGTWLIDPQDFIIAASDGDITGTALSNNLADNDIVIESVDGATAGNGDIFVRDDVVWSSGTKLTLRADRNIYIHASIDASQDLGGSVALEYGQGSVAAGNTARFDFGLSGGAQFAGSIELQGGDTFSTKLGSDGVTIDYFVISDLPGLQHMNADPSAAYALGSDINGTGGTLVPIGNQANRFTGVFDGLGHTIEGLNINRATANPQTARDYAGVFGYVGSSGEIRNVGTNGVSVRGRSYVGGLVGYNEGVISHSFSTTPEVRGTTYVGGLAGFNAGTITLSYATGNIVGSAGLGGLVGTNNGEISQSFATGNLTSGGSSVGGLAGDNHGRISLSYATGNVNGSDNAGGLVGYNYASGEIDRSYATGSVSGGDFLGGLVGENAGAIEDSYYATSNVNGTPINNNGDNSGAYLGNVHGEAKTLAELRQLDTFAAWDTDIDDQGGTGSVWRIYDGFSTPLLRAFLTQLSIDSADDKKTYDGLAYTGASYAPTGADPTHISVGGDAIGAIDAGSYAMVIYSGQQGYDLIGNTEGTLTIDPRVLSLTGSRDYDGTNEIATSILTLSNLVAGESLDLTGSGATMDDKHAGLGKALSDTGTIALADGANGKASNYTLTGGEHTVDIAPRAITVSGVTANSKEYDGTTNADLVYSDDNFSGILNGDDITATGAFSDKNAGTGKLVTFLTGGADAGNYVFTGQTSTTADITPKALTVSGVTASDKVYDGNRNAALTYDASNLDGLINDDLITITGLFDDKNAGVGKTVAFGFGGDDAGNYQITGQDSTTADITPKDLTAIYTAENKVYDRTETATITATSEDIIEGDEVAISASGSFADKNAGNGKTVTIADGELTGDDAGNYKLLNTDDSVTANITPKEITGTITAADKVYDGTTTAVTSGELSGVIAGDDLSLISTSGTFVDKNASAGKTVNVSGTVDGADAGNYTVTLNDTTTADITPKTLTVAGITASDKVYDGTTNALVDYSDGNLGGLIGGDDITVFGDFTDKNVGTNKTVNLALGGEDQGNYVITGQDSTTASITPKALTASYTAADKVYDGTVTASVSGTSAGIVTDDDVVITANGSFADKNVGNEKTVTVSGGALTGDDADNYTLVNTDGVTTASITPKAITGTIIAMDKIYDGTTVADTSGSFAGVIEGDELNLTTSGSFVDRNAGDDKLVNVSGTVTGADADNYTVTLNDTSTASITPKTVTVSGITARDKPFDGTSVAELVFGDDNFAGLIGGDEVFASGAFTDSRVGANKTVNLSFSGADAGNYLFEGQKTTKASIEGGATSDTAAEAAVALADQEGSRQQKPRPLPVSPDAATAMQHHIQVASTGIRMPENVLSDEEEK